MVPCKMLCYDLNTHLPQLFKDFKDFQKLAKMAGFLEQMCFYLTFPFVKTIGQVQGWVQCRFTLFSNVIHRTFNLGIAAMHTILNITNHSQIQAHLFQIKLNVLVAPSLDSSLLKCHETCRKQHKISLQKCHNMHMFTMSLC